MPGYHHVSSGLSRLTEGTIDFVIECVRDANEVLHGVEVLDARDMIRIARSVFETECLFELEPRAFVEELDTPRSDWTLACMAEGLSQAAQQLNVRGAHEAAKRARADWRLLLRRLVDSPLRSPLLDYGRALSELIDHCPPAEARERLNLLPRYLAEDLRTNNGANVLGRLRAIGEAHLQLEQAELAFHIFTRIVRYDPLEIWTYLNVADAVKRAYPEVAFAAAERGLLLMPREDKHDVRPRLRAIIEETRGKTTATMSATARALISELQAKPGKRSRGSLTTLCRELVPRIDLVPERDEEPLPDEAGLAQLRRDLRTLPRPRKQLPSAPLPARSNSSAAFVGADLTAVRPLAVAQAKVGRNDPCTCGSNKKWKRCCGAR